jgi:hypothetical protein
MTEKPPVHLRFIGATIYCSVIGTQVKLDPEHRYGEAYTCPGCGHEEPARTGLPDFRLKTV